MLADCLRAELAGSGVVVLNSCSATMYGLRIFVWSICLPVILGTGVLWVSTGTHPCGSPSRQDDGEARAPALHTLDDVLRFRGDEEYRAVLLQIIIIIIIIPWPDNHNYNYNRNYNYNL